MKNRPIQYFDVQPPEMKYDDGFINEMTRKFAIETAKSFDKAIVDKIIEIARNNGITDLVLLNEEFIVTAIKNEIERREQVK